MLSRMAESLYWIGRYVERAEQTARLTEVTFSHTARDGLDARRRKRAGSVTGRRCSTSSASSSAFPPRRAGGRRGDRAGASDLLVRERELDRGVHRAARATTRARCATSWRPRCGRRSTASTSTCSGPARRRRAASGAESTTRFCRSIVEFSQLLQGVTDSTMPREEGWYFLQAGKFLERAEWTARTIDVNYRLLVGVERRARRSPCPGRRGGRPAAVGERCCARSRRTSRTTASRAGASGRPR